MHSQRKRCGFRRTDKVCSRGRFPGSFSVQRPVQKCHKGTDSLHRLRYAGENIEDTRLSGLFRAMQPPTNQTRTKLVESSLAACLDEGSTPSGSTNNEREGCVFHRHTPLFRYVRICCLALLGKMAVECDDGLNAFVEMVETVILVGGVDCVLAKAESHQHRLDA